VKSKSFEAKESEKSQKAVEPKFILHLSYPLELIVYHASHWAGKYLEIIQRRKEAKSRTLQVRRDYNRTVRE